DRRRQRAHRAAARLCLGRAATLRRVANARSGALGRLARPGARLELQALTRPSRASEIDLAADAGDGLAPDPDGRSLPRQPDAAGAVEARALRGDVALRRAAAAD